MIELLAQTFSRDLAPHGHSMAWRPGLLYLHAASDALIAVSCFAIPFALYRVLRRRPDMPFRRLWQSFALFLLACGAARLLSVWTIWNPDYGAEGVAKALAAGLSVAAAVLAVRAAPRILDLPNARDLERRAAEQTQALAEANERLRSIVDASPSAILTAGEDGAIELANPAAVKLFGYSQSELVGRNVSTLLESPDLDARGGSLASFAQSDEGGRQRADHVVTGRRKDGSTAPLNVAVSEFASAQGPRFTAILTDGSERQRCEERLERSIRELESANRALSERNADLDDFAHTVSHDLKEPLRGIQTYCWTLDEDLGEQLPEEARVVIKRVENLAKRMDRMVESVLQYSRLGRQTQPRDADLEELVQESLDMLHSTLQERGCSVERPERFPTVCCDPTATTEILKNLISNASKYNDKPEKRVEIGWRSGEIAGAVRLFVRDNGIGIDPAQLQNVFRIFFRLHREGDYGQGAGAGLAIVKKLAERQGGRVWVESVLGQGSTFWLELGTPTG